MQNFIEFDVIIAEPCLVLYSTNTLSQIVISQVVLSQQFIFCKFLQISVQLKQILYYSKLPIGLFFHALSDKITKMFIAIFISVNILACRAVGRALIGGGGGCIFIYSGRARLVSFEIKLISKEVSRAEPEYMNIHPLN